MTIAVTPPASPRNLAISLAACLFAAATAFAPGSSDTGFADCLIARGYSQLYTGLNGETDNAALADCVAALAGCDHLSSAVRKNLSGTLQGLSEGTVPHMLALEIVAAAASSHAHKMILGAVRAVGAEGLGEIAGAIELLAPAPEGED